MEIEIVTTKKKLTKSIIQQMPWLSIKNYVGQTMCVCLGHIRINNNSIGLVKYNDMYYKFDLYWKQGKDNYMVQDGYDKLEFSSEEIKNQHFTAYNTNKEKCLALQISY